MSLIDSKHGYLQAWVWRITLSCMALMKDEYLLVDICGCICTGNRYFSNYGLTTSVLLEIEIQV